MSKGKSAKSGYKKILSLLLAASLGLGIAMPALAAEQQEAESANEAAVLGFSSVALGFSLSVDGWDTTIFGQSTDLTFNSSGAEIFDPNSPDYIPQGNNYAEGSVDGTLVVESRGGKLNNAHDGIVFHYITLDMDQNFRLEADMVVNGIGPLGSGNPNGQEGGGIMVRDVNGPPRKDPMEEGFEELAAASNMALVGALRNGSNKGTYRPSYMYREGVNNPSGTVGSTRPTSALADVQDVNGAPIRISLERTNTKLISGVSLDNGATWEYKDIPAHPGMLGVIDSDAVQLGFFAARNCKVTFSNIALATSQGSPEAYPGFTYPQTSPRIDIYSDTVNATADYNLSFAVNYNGQAVVTVGDVIGEPMAVTALETVDMPITLVENTTVITIDYTPQGEAPISRSITVTNLGYAQQDALYASPDGVDTAQGTVKDPVSLSEAVNRIGNGQTIYLMEGTYDSLTITQEKSGIAGGRKVLRPYSGAKVIIPGIQLRGNYWHLLDIVSDGGQIRVSGSYNILENLEVMNNSDTGLQLSGSGTDTTTWPRDNLMLNCTSHHNMDSSLINADGFAAKLGVGPNNVFDGCIAYNNIDDGWDLYNKLDEGANYPVTIRNCIAYGNGKTYGQTSAGGNGFKLGGEGIPVAHMVSNCISFDNLMDGFTDNFNPGQLELTNNTAFDNQRYNFMFRTNNYYSPEEQGVFINNLSLRTTHNGFVDSVSGNVDTTTYLWDGSQTVNSEGTVVSLEEFISIDLPGSYSRNKNNEIVYGDFLRPKSGSWLASAGRDGNYLGALAPQSTGSGSSSGGSSGGGSSKPDFSNSSSAPTFIRETLTVNAQQMQSAVASMQASGRSKVRITSQGIITVPANVWALLDNDTAVDFDTVENNIVQVRITIRQPAEMRGEMQLSGQITGAAVEGVKNLFAKWFKNKVEVVCLDYTGSFGQPVEIAAKVNLSDINLDNLCLYTYSRTDNLYRRIANPSCWVDQNGYLHFITEDAGVIIITEGPLEKK